MLWYLQLQAGHPALSHIPRPHRTKVCLSLLPGYEASLLLSLAEQVYNYLWPPSQAPTWGLGEAGVHTVITKIEYSPSPLEFFFTIRSFIVNNASHVRSILENTPDKGDFYTPSKQLHYTMRRFGKRSKCSAIISMTHTCL